MSLFEPIAIIGQGCVLPGAHNPEQFWDLLLRGENLLSEANPLLDWGTPDGRILCDPDEHSRDRTWSKSGGYVQGFDEVFDPEGFALDPELIRQLDPLFKWTLYAARQAWLESGQSSTPKAGVVLGNLSYPTRALNDFALGVWKGAQTEVAHNRYMSGLPAHLISQALGLGEAFSLDAACASSLYAMKLSCDKLHDRTMDVMLAGGVNHADDLFLHVGFCALNALSRSGQSRPFHRDADGLVPAEGAGFVVLKRLDDAVRDGDDILGVIRGIGLSNDGRGRGMLTPSEEGQWRAMRAAYDMSGLEPRDISMIECHATGTPLGDATEVRSMARVFEGMEGEARVPIGSSKSNFGHLITASGVAGLMKALASMKHKVRPPTLHAKEEPISWLDETPFRLIHEAEAWESEGPRRAAINNFGFGGNNAHLLVEEWTGQTLPQGETSPKNDPIVLTHMAACVGPYKTLQEWRGALLSGETPETRHVDQIELDLRELKFPPNDMQHALPQQLLALKVGLDLQHEIAALPQESTGLYMGMQCDTEIARYGARWRSDSPETQDKFVGELVAAGVLGTMPNIVANRLNSQFNLLGPSFTVSSEEGSGLVALELASRALNHGEIDAALVGAVDLCVDPTHEAAAKALLPTDRHTSGDACVMMVLKRLSDAQRDGDPIIAQLTPELALPSNQALGLEQGSVNLSARFGHAHAASGLVHAAAAAILVQHRATLASATESAQPELLPSYLARVGVSALGAQHQVVQWHSAQPQVQGIAPYSDHLKLALFCAPTYDALRDAVSARQLATDSALAESASQGVYRLSLAFYEGEFDAVVEDLLASWQADPAETLTQLSPRCWLGHGHTPSAIALVNPAATVPRGSARALLLAHPLLGLGLPDTGATSWLYHGAPDSPESWANANQLVMTLRLNLLKAIWGVNLSGVVTQPQDNAVGIALGNVLGAHVQLVPEDGEDELDRLTLALGQLAALGVATTWQNWAASLPLDFFAKQKKQAMLSFDGHLPAIDIPKQAPQPTQTTPNRSTVQTPPYHTPSPSRPTMSQNKSQKMPAAPSLPSVLADQSMQGGQDNVPPAPQAPTPVAQAAPRPRTFDAPQILEADASSDVHAYWGRHLDQMTQVHQAFLQQQAQMQRDFLQSRTQLGETLGQIVQGTQVVEQAQPEQQTQAPQVPMHLLQTPQPAPAEMLFEPKVVPVRSMAPEVPAPLATLRAKAPQAPVSAPSMTPPVTNAPTEGVRLVGNIVGQQQKITPHHLKPKPKGPTFGYDALAIHASGKISEIFGPEFECQDDHHIQVRMPEPPLLLCDRVTGIDCTKGVVGNGTLWCESDIPQDAWFLHEGRMPVGITIESGQADLMLISWMGADFENQGTRAYRLLGCDLMFHEGGLARPGDTLCYDIHIDGHANQGDIRLFFFHYDLEIDEKVRLSVRNGQAGFFTYEELADSNGILWRPEDEDLEEMRQKPLAPAPCPTSKCSFSAEEVQAFAEGNVFDVFGPGFERAAAHTKTPTIQADKMRFMDEVLEFDPEGGPWGRGYLKAVQHISPDDWFFDGHFKNDPCMPGTLMFEGCVQTMAFYMAASGWTIECDGWVFEPIPEELYKLRCRGQVTPSSKELIYEVMVREVHDGPTPKLYAELLCTVDGLGAFHCARMGLQLVPAWPMDRQPELLENHQETRPVATVNGFELGYDSLLACAWGTPSRAFGPMYKPFDSHRKVARLPGPPYHFISRVTEVDETKMGAMYEGTELEVEYDVPTDAWYFDVNGAKVMPYAVLLEAGLQPCGWLASYVGCALTKETDICFRNLDGTSTQHLEVTPDSGILKTYVKLKTLAQAGGNIIVAFDVEMTTLDGDTVFTMDTVFGFFPPEALAAQAGLPVTDLQRERLEQGSKYHVDLRTQPKAFFGKTLRLADEKLLMIDELTGWWPKQGEAKLGVMRAKKHIDPREWFFKAHFFQDPVQPGSLGLEAIAQLLQAAMIESKLHKGIKNPRFEAVALDEAFAWKYRGQVLTHNKEVSTTVEILDVIKDDLGVLAIAQGSLWVDGMRIYQATRFGMRIVSGRAKKSRSANRSASNNQLGSESSEDPDPAGGSLEQTWSLNLQDDPWLLDHCPTYTRPAVPMMSVLDIMAKAALDASGDANLRVKRVERVSLKRWLVVDPEVNLKTEVVPDEEGTYHVTLSLWWDAPKAQFSRFDPVATCSVELVHQGEQSAPSDVSPSSLDGYTQEEISRYDTGSLFHGPSLQVLTQVWSKTQNAVGQLNLGVARDVRNHALNPALLDGALQVIPHDAIESWWIGHQGGVIAYPHQVESLEIFGPTPTGDTLCRTEVQFVEGEGRFVRFLIHIYESETLWATMKLTEVLLPKGPLGELDGRTRHAFIKDASFDPKAALGTQHGASWQVKPETVALSNWFAGTLERVYNTQASRLGVLTRDIAIKECVSQRHGVHPSQVQVDASGHASFAHLPGVNLDVESSEDASGVWSAKLTSDAMGLAIDQVKTWWQNKLGVSRHDWFGNDLYGAMLERFVQDVVIEDPKALMALRGQSVLFLGNHESQIESLLITILTSVLTDTTVVTMANAKHKAGWVGELVRDLFSYPEAKDPENIVYFQQNDRESMFTLLSQLKARVKEDAISLMVHAPGTRATQPHQKVERLSSVFLDLAVELKLPIVPLCFSRGIPAQGIENKVEFPWQQGSQRYSFGSPILPEELAALPYAQRRKRVLGAINATYAPSEPVATGNQPHHNEVLSLQAQGMDEINATLWSLLHHVDGEGDEVQSMRSGEKNVALGIEVVQWIEKIREKRFLVG